MKSCKMHLIVLHCKTQYADLLPGSFWLYDNLIEPKTRLPSGPDDHVQLWRRIEESRSLTDSFSFV